ncbi:hypothetical protein AGMMS50239_29580 [Bacteroidia bacterium]|nr:hypothetical protein AGMMS50239_29580 [Bacteroidia bacterium]
MKTSMKAFIFYVIVVVMFYGCSTPLNIEGAYSQRKNLNNFELYSDSTFIYKLTRYYGSSSTNTYSDGKWKRIDENTIVLNSRIINNIVPLRVEKINTEDPRIQVCEDLAVIQEKSSCCEYKTEDFSITPYIDGNNYLEMHPELSDEPLQIPVWEILGLKPDSTVSENKFIPNPPIKRGSYCFYADKPFDCLYFKIKKQPKTIWSTAYTVYYTLHTEKIKIPVQSGELVKVSICLNDSLFSYRIFDNEVLKIKGNKLIFKDKEKNNKTNKLYLNK